MVKNISFGAHLVNIVRQTYIQNIEEAKTFTVVSHFFAATYLRP